MINYGSSTDQNGEIEQRLALDRDLFDRLIVRYGGWLDGRKIDREGGAVVGGAGDIHVAAVRFCYPLYEAESESSAASELLASAVGLVVSLEDVRQILWCDAGSCIRNS